MRTVRPRSAIVPLTIILLNRAIAVEAYVAPAFPERAGAALGATVSPLFVTIPRDRSRPDARPYRGGGGGFDDEEERRYDVTNTDRDKDRDGGKTAEYARLSFQLSEARSKLELSEMRATAAERRLRGLGGAASAAKSQAGKLKRESSARAEAEADRSRLKRDIEAMRARLDEATALTEEARSSSDLIRKKIDAVQAATDRELLETKADADTKIEAIQSKWEITARRVEAEAMEDRVGMTTDIIRLEGELKDAMAQAERLTSALEVEKTDGARRAVKDRAESLELLSKTRAQSTVRWIS